MAPPSAPPTPTSPFPSSNTPQPSSLSRLTLSDKLLLAQAVHHIGSSPPDWGRVSSILLSHPLIRTKGRLEQASKAGITLGRIFGSRECERAWVALMRQYNLVLQPGEKETINESDGDGASTLANRAKEARGLPPKTDRGSQLALAQFLYAERIREIQESIKIKEQRFKALAADIEALNSGALDAKLSAEVTLINSQAITPAAEISTRPPPKDRTGTSGPTATTPGGTSRVNRRPSRSDSITVTPSLAASNEAGNAEMSMSNDGSQDVDMSGIEDSQVLDETLQEDDLEADADRGSTKEVLPAAVEQDEGKAAAEEAQEDPTAMIAEEKAEEEPASKTTRSSKRKRISDAGLKRPLAQEAQSKEADVEEEQEEEGNEGGEGDVDMEDDTQQKQAQPRRSRRAGRGTGDDDGQTPVAPASAVTSSTKTRLGALRSRETSGASPDGEEEGESADVDTSRSTIDRNSRTSVSPTSVRKGRGTSRISSNKATSRRSRGGSNTSRHEGELTEAERDRIEREKAKRKNEKVLMMLLNEVSNHTHGNLFHSAIKEQDAPDYYTLIRHPLDIKTIRTRVKEGQIVNSVQLRRALNQMFANSLIYNRPGTEIHRMALEMRDSSEEIIDRFEQTQLSASYSRR